MCSWLSNFSISIQIVLYLMGIKRKLVFVQTLSIFHKPGISTHTNSILVK